MQTGLSENEKPRRNQTLQMAPNVIVTTDTKQQQQQQQPLFYGHYMAAAIWKITKIAISP